jgi:Histidine kinase-, DNA gyrase B-, and HSP90-like ATPase
MSAKALNAALAEQAQAICVGCLDTDEALRSDCAFNARLSPPEYAFSFIGAPVSPPGVLEESIPRLFEPFYRPAAARSGHTGGSGLVGLAIAKRSIGACDGSVTAKNREGGGLMVECKIPQSSIDRPTPC